MDSNNTRAKSREALAPQRRNGKARVAAVLKAAADVISEKGYTAATMAEIAARAQAPIGSLYRFFPNKETLSDALIQRYIDRVKDSFDTIDKQAATQPLESTADAILDFTTNLHSETKAMVGLLDARPDWPGKRSEFRELILKRLARTLLRCAPTLPKREAKDIAVILLHNMKLMKTLNFSRDVVTSKGAVNELRQMNRYYIVNRIKNI